MALRNAVTRRGLLTGAGSGAAVLILAACGTVATTQEMAEETTEEAPQAKESMPEAEASQVVWSCYRLTGRMEGWDDTFAAIAETTGIDIEVSWQDGSGYWDRRRAEFAAGAAPVDLMVNQLNWVIPGGLTGMFPDLYEFMRRDNVDLDQYFPTALTSWAWKGQLWAQPFQHGGEVVFFNKQLFDEKGVSHPHKDWTYDDLISAVTKLNDPDNNRWALDIGQNGLHYMMGTFVYNFGGELLNDVRDRALYGEDQNSIRGAALDVDLHTVHKATPPVEARESLGSGIRPMDAQMVSMEFNGNFRHNAIRNGIGVENLDFAPPPVGPSGIQRVSTGGNSWSILALSEQLDDAWEVLRVSHTREILESTPQIEVISWPPLFWAATSEIWLRLYEGTNIIDVQNVWQSGGHDLLVLPEGSQAWSTMNEPMGRALAGEIDTTEAMQESAARLNELFSQRPDEWK